MSDRFIYDDWKDGDEEDMIRKIINHLNNELHVSRNK
jgi:hypothetical protein